MIGVVIITHGKLGEEFVKAAEHICGPQQGIQAISIMPDDDMSSCHEAISTAIQAVDKGNGVVLLTDLFGGTPSNIAYSYTDQKGIEVIAGVNLPMLIELLKQRTLETLEKATNIAHEIGKKYIRIGSEILKSKAVE